MSAVTAGKPCAPLNESSAGISYQPFFGKYATTGQSKSGEEGGGNEPSVKKKPRRSGGGSRKGNGGGPAATLEVHEAPSPPAREPAAPRPSAPPPVGKTGGAEPH
jgi:hypothetical protein